MRQRENEGLKNTRGVSFERVVILLERGDVIEIVEHPNQTKYLRQKMTVIRDYCIRAFSSLHARGAMGCS